jgi:hypothetical protein
VPIHIHARGGAARPDMRIGDLVTYEGKQYVLCGLEPMSVPERRAEIEDPATGERLVVPFATLADSAGADEV